MATCKQPLIFGEVLFDCFEDGARVLGGAPFNVAWHCQGFGLSPLFVSSVGEDEDGRQISALMQSWQMDPAGLQHQVDYPTGRVNVTIDQGEPSYEIVENSAWDFIEPAEYAASTDSILYHGSLAMRNAVSRQALEHIKSTHTGKVFVDINLRPPWWNPQTVHQALSRCDYLKLNIDELASVMPDGESIDEKVNSLITQYKLEMLILTRGDEGASVYTTEGETQSIQPQTTNAVVDVVGAGDAFSSVILLGLCRQWPIELSLQRAQQFASHVVGVRGATINDASVYHALCSEWQ